MHARCTDKPRCFATPRNRQRRRGLAFMLLALASALNARAAEPVLELRAGQGDWSSALALESSVEMQVRGLIAEVVVRQRYINDSEAWLEGRYLLPLPEQAAVGRLRVQVGRRVIEGEVQEKAAARQAFAAAAANGQRAALVEQSRPNLFRTGLTNIGPGEEIVVEIGYWQAVDYRDGEFSLRLPLTFTTPYVPADATLLLAEAGDGAIGNLDRNPGSVAVAGALEPTVSLSIDLDAGLPLASIHSPSHALAVGAAGIGAKAGTQRVTLAELVDLADREFELRWRPLPSTLPQRAVFTEEVDGEHYALLMLVPPTQPVAALPRELVLVLDVSGSMHGDALRQAVAALDHALLRLRPEDRFNLLWFSDRTSVLYPASQPADRARIDHARQALAGLRAEGGTEMTAALRGAFAGEPPAGFVRQVVLATDAGIGNEAALFAQIERERGDARLFPIGIGSAPNGYFIRKAAELGRGSHALIRDLAEVSNGMDGLFARLDRPVLHELELDWPQAAEVYPERLPDLYHGEPLTIVARLPQLSGTLSVHGRTRDQPWRSAVQLDGYRTATGAGVGRVWARARIDALEDALRRGMPETDVRNGIVDVALKHGLASRYTSLVAVERDPVRPSDAPLGSTQIANAVPAGSEGSLAMAQGATPARSRLGLAIALLLLAGGLLRGRQREPMLPAH